MARLSLFLYFCVCISMMVQAQQLRWSSFAGGAGMESFSSMAYAADGTVYFAYTSDNQDSLVTAGAAFPKKNYTMAGRSTGKAQP